MIEQVAGESRTLAEVLETRGVAPLHPHGRVTPEVHADWQERARVRAIRANRSTGPGRKRSAAPGRQSGPLTPEVKARILGLNAARLFGVDPAAHRNPVPGDYVARLRAAHREMGSAPSLTQYGWVLARPEVR